MPQHQIRLLNDLATTAGTSQDPLGMDAVRAVARQIVEAVADPDMASSIPLSVARHAVDRDFNMSELIQILDILIAGRKSGRIKKPGAYFLTAARQLYRRNGIQW